MNNINCKLALIIVTYNRKELLLRCLKASLSQSYLPVAIFIIDNASTDGTYECLLDNHMLENNRVEIQYHRLNENGGGAGGFYHGRKMAHEKGGYDAYVMMDDDGLPDKDELNFLAQYASHYDYINAFVISEDDHSKTSFPRGDYGFERKLIEQEANEEGLIFNYAAPFNGTLYTKKLVDKVGFPNPDMFFQGDEVNYHKRILKVGITPVTVIHAIHYHPCKIPQVYKLNIGGKVLKVSLESTPLRIYCKHRNLVYNRFTMYDYGYIAITYFFYSYLYLFKQKSWKNYAIFNRAVWAGFCRNLKGHRKYIKG